jgi:hypothetical protein
MPAMRYGIPILLLLLFLLFFKKPKKQKTNKKKKKGVEVTCLLKNTILNSYFCTPFCFVYFFSLHVKQIASVDMTAADAMTQKQRMYARLALQVEKTASDMSFTERLAWEPEGDEVKKLLAELKAHTSFTDQLAIPDKSPQLEVKREWFLVNLLVGNQHGAFYCIYLAGCIAILLSFVISIGKDELDRDTFLPLPPQYVAGNATREYRC